MSPERSHENERLTDLTESVDRPRAEKWLCANTVRACRNQMGNLKL